MIANISSRQMGFGQLGGTQDGGNIQYMFFGMGHSLNSTHSIKLTDYKSLQRQNDWVVIASVWVVREYSERWTLMQVVMNTPNMHCWHSDLPPDKLPTFRWMAPRLIVKFKIQNQNSWNVVGEQACREHWWAECNTEFVKCHAIRWKRLHIPLY